ncbi:DUF2075 domain-containing protein [Pauljensenia sp. 20925_1_27]
MTGAKQNHEHYTITRRLFNDETFKDVATIDEKLTNWPVVYILTSSTEVYVGETLNYCKRMKQHLKNDHKSSLQLTHLILHDEFNKSVCLDLESTLIDLFVGDGRLRVLNANRGIVDANYHQRAYYRQIFNDIFDILRKENNIFSKSRFDIENSDLYKYSPFKKLNQEQEAVANSIWDQLIERFERRDEDFQEIIIEALPGTGKTILATYLTKLFADYSRGYTSDDEYISFSNGNADTETRASQHRLKIGLVIPPAPLRFTVKQVFKMIDGLDETMVLSPFDIPKSLIENDEKYDLLIVDESHLLNKFGFQANRKMLNDFRRYNNNLFPEEDPHGDKHTQLDWMRHCSNNVIFMVDMEQSTQPAHIDSSNWEMAISNAKRSNHYFHLTCQMRMQISEADRYMSLIRAIFDDKPLSDNDVPHFGDYDFRIFTNLKEMQAALSRREKEYGLCRMLAGFDWPWVSKSNYGDDAPYDIELDEMRFRWQRDPTSWMHSAVTSDEVGMIHSVQGYDLNYAGVIIGPNVGLDSSGKYCVNRQQYCDGRGKANMNLFGKTMTDEQLRRHLANVYRVLLTRGIRGTYVYAEASGLSERFHQIQAILDARRR